MKNTFAFIFVRAGSKGLPNKNLLLLDGKPLFMHSIDLAKQLDDVEKIFVSTDSAEIKELAEHAGVEVIDRPQRLAADDSPEFDAWKHAVDCVCEQWGADFTFLSLPATSPTRSLGDVRACLDAFDESIDCVVTVTPSNHSPHFNMVTRDTNGGTRLLYGKSGVIRRQDAPECYNLTTVAYVSRPDFILNNNSIFDGLLKSVVIPKSRAIDIDDIWDFRLCELIIQNKRYLKSG